MCAAVVRCGEGSRPVNPDCLTCEPTSTTTPTDADLRHNDRAGHASALVGLAVEICQGMKERGGGGQRLRMSLEIPLECFLPEKQARSLHRKRASSLLLTVGAGLGELGGDGLTRGVQEVLKQERGKGCT